MVVFLTTTAIFPSVMALAVGDCAPAFKAVSPGMPPPMGLVVGLIVGLLAAGLWGTSPGTDRRHREASALRSAGAFGVKSLLDGAPSPHGPAATPSALRAPP